MTELRCITYLTPSLPLGLFEAAASVLRARLGVSVSLQVETSRSGPLPTDDPFRRGEVDLGFVCTPSYAWLSAQEDAAVDLLSAALVPDDPRCEGRPVFFSDVVVRADHPAVRLDDLRGSRWAYNDTCSQSGFYSMLRRLDELGERAEAFFGEAHEVGSHAQALLAVTAGDADVASIDSNVLRHLAEAAADLRVLESLGPVPIQPILVRRDLSAGLKQDAAAALLAVTDELRAFGFLGASPVGPADYAQERQELLACSKRLGPVAAR